MNKMQCTSIAFIDVNSARELKNGFISVLQRQINVAKSKLKRFNKSDRYPIRENAWNDQV